MRLKVAIGPLFPTAVIFRGLGLVLYRKTDYKKPNPTKFSANTPLGRACAPMLRGESVYITVRRWKVAAFPTNMRSAFLPRVRRRSLTTRCGINAWPLFVFVSNSRIFDPPFRFPDVVVVTSFDRRVICIYDYYSGWANVMECCIPVR